MEKEHSYLNKYQKKHLQSITLFNYYTQTLIPSLACSVLPLTSVKVSDRNMIYNYHSTNVSMASFFTC